jgi:glyoxylase I family protein
MQKVNGIGGVFFRAKDTAALSAWYEKHLGVAPPPASYDEQAWQQEAGPTIFAPMDERSGHFRKDANLYINFRVVDLDAMCDQLESAGVKVDRDPEHYPNGRFASLEDPEGNQVQLWQPE